MDGLTGLEGGWAGSPERATVSVVPRAASLWVPVCGGRRWATSRGTFISRPEHRTLEPLSLSSLPPIWSTKGRGEGWRLSWSRKRAKPPVKGANSNKESSFSPGSCAPARISFGSGFNSKTFFCWLQKGPNGMSHGPWLPPDRGQQARQPAGKAREKDREIGGRVPDRLGAGVVVGAAWAGLWAGLGCDWQTAHAAFAPFSVGLPAPFQSASVHFLNCCRPSSVVVISRCELLSTRQLPVSACAQFVAVVYEQHYSRTRYSGTYLQTVHA